jgi:hypothetical protein
MIKDLWNTIRLYIEDRLSSPLLTGFLFAWSIINYRFFLILFSNERFIEKIALIEKYVFPSDEIKLYKGILYPLAAALIYVLIYPFIDRYIFRAWRWHQHKLIQIRQRIDEERPLSEKDRTQLLSRIYEAERKQGEETQKLDTTIESQLVRIKELEDRIESQQGRIIELESQASAIAQDKTTSENHPPSVQQDVDRREESIFEQALTLDTLSSYVTYRFPNKPVGEDVLKLLLRDIDKNRYNKIRDIDNVVQRVTDAVTKYEEEKPELFTKGADYLTKSLGFVDQSFRSRHGFSDETRLAFVKFDQQPSTNPLAADRSKLENFKTVEIDVLEAIANAERENLTASEDWIQSQISGDKIEKKYFLDDLVRRGYLKTYLDQNSKPYYALDHDGRRVLLTLGKAGGKRNLR